MSPRGRVIQRGGPTQLGFPLLSPSCPHVKPVMDERYDIILYVCWARQHRSNFVPSNEKPIFRVGSSCSGSESTMPVIRASRVLYLQPPLLPSAAVSLVTLLCKSEACTIRLASSRRNLPPCSRSPLPARAGSPNTSPITSPRRLTTTLFCSRALSVFRPLCVSRPLSASRPLSNSRPLPFLIPFPFLVPLPPPVPFPFPLSFPLSVPQLTPYFPL